MRERTVALLVEDDRTIVDLVRANLSVRGFDVVVSDGSDLLRAFEREQPEIILLDLMLPDTDGFELCRDLRERSGVAIIVLSARRGEHDKVRALHLGADDYLTKPFGIDELLARITATLRRTRAASRPSADDGDERASVVQVGEVTIDLDAHLVTRAGARVHLTPTEFALLRELALHPGKLLTHRQLLRRVWGPGYETQTEYTRVYVRRLRAKLESSDGPPLIVTEPRAGYRLASFTQR